MSARKLTPEELREKRNAQARERRKDPAVREKQNAQARERYVKDPVMREKRYAQQRERRKDPAVREKQNARHREYVKDPVRREKRNIWRREKRKDPIWAAKEKAQALSSGRNRRCHFPAYVVEAMMQAQKGLCAICSQPFKNSRDTHADHCHKTKTPRGLLCTDCNLGIGRLKDSPPLLRRAATYLEAPPAKFYIEVVIA